MVVASGARGRDDDREAWREEASVIETMMGGRRGGGYRREILLSVPFLLCTSGKSHRHDGSSREK